MTTIDTGDTVFHKPTGEYWIVACVQGDRLSWCGWPEGMANVNDCKLVKRATTEERQELIHTLSNIKDQHDHRGRYARYILEKEKHEANTQNNR